MRLRNFPDCPCRKNPPDTGGEAWVLRSKPRGTRPFMTARIFSRGRSKVLGQSLVEFVMVMPVLLLMLLGAFLIGMGLMQGSSASMAMKAAVMKKIDLADEGGDATNAAIALIEADTAGAVDSVQVDSGNGVGGGNGNAVTSVLVGSKEYNPNVPFLVPVTFMVTQGINNNLLQANKTANPATTFSQGPSLGAFTPPAAPAGIPAEIGLATINTPCSNVANYNVSGFDAQQKAYFQALVQGFVLTSGLADSYCSEFPLVVPDLTFSSSPSY